jgi:hypothetical protein
METNSGPGVKESKKGLQDLYIFDGLMERRERRPRNIHRELHPNGSPEACKKAVRMKAAALKPAEGRHASIAVQHMQSSALAMPNWVKTTISKIMFK